VKRSDRDSWRRFACDFAIICVLGTILGIPFVIGVFILLEAGGFLG